MNYKLFYEGKMFDAYEYFGVHQVDNGFTFTTYAPNAKKIAIVGDFNQWQEQWMILDQGVFHFHSETAQYGQFYKYRIYVTETDWVEHTDPFAFSMELRPGCCSVITDLSSYQFQDQAWLEKRSVGFDNPINIYELHVGSWKQSSEAENNWYYYDKLAVELIPYLLENHYTHVEFMPLMEHPFDGSWGYQVTGFFAPTSRYGSPVQLMKLIDQLHQAGIGAILDFVPVHFAIDSYGLREYDGTPLYEYPHGDVTESEWGTCNFIYNRREVQCFMQSAAHFWLEKYHFDGLRMDAVSRMIYWHGDEARGINPNSLEFLKQMNLGIKELHPDIMLIAEDSSTYQGVTKPVRAGGLGFDYKWALGWMHDTLEYFQTSPEYRGKNYHKLTFGMSYFPNEKYLLALSHDENVHGKATILQKMNGQYQEKFPQGRALYLFMMVHPGKKLNFMGNEIGQLREWDEQREQDWEILKYPNHDSFHKYMKDLNAVYLKYQALHQDYQPDNFQWLDCNAMDSCIYALARFAEKKSVAAIFNLSDKVQMGYQLILPEQTKQIRTIIDSDWECYGGTTQKGKQKWRRGKQKDKVELIFSLPAYSGILIEFH